MHLDLFGRKCRISPMADFRYRFSAWLDQELQFFYNPPELASAECIYRETFHTKQLTVLEKNTSLTRYEIALIKWEVLTQLLFKFPQKLRPDIFYQFFISARLLFDSTLNASESSKVRELYSKFWVTTNELVQKLTAYVVLNSESILHCTKGNYAARNILRIFCQLFVEAEPLPQNSISKLCKTESKICTEKYKERIREKFRQDILSWTQNELGRFQDQGKGRCEIEDVISLLSELTSIMRIMKPYWTSVLKSLDVNLFQVVLGVWTEQIFSFITGQHILNHRQKPSALTAADVFRLYRNLLSFLSLNDPPLNPGFPHSPSSGPQTPTRIFLPNVIQWIEVIRVRNQKRIRNAIKFDSLEKVNDASFVSSSAIDVSEILLKTNEFWDELAWPVPEEAYCLLILLIQVIWYGVSEYIKSLVVKLRKHTISDGNVRRAEMMRKECIALNDIEQVIQCYSRAIDRFKISTLMKQIAVQDGRDVQLRHYALDLPHVIKAMHIRVNKLLANVLRSCRLTQILSHRLGTIFSEIKPILSERTRNIFKSVEDDISKLKCMLVPSTFLNVLDVIWKRTLATFNRWLRACSTQMDKPVTYYQSVHILFMNLDQLIKGYYEAGVGRASISRAFRKNLVKTTKIQTLLRLLGSTTKELQIEYLTIRFCEQSQVRLGSKLSVGHLTIRAEYLAQSQTLKLEILNTVFNEDVHHSYVKLQVLLRSGDQKAPYLYTQVKSTKYAAFETLFQVPIQWIHWRGGGMIRFWIKTRPNLLFQPKGQIIGEAFLPLETIATNLLDVVHEHSQFVQPYTKLPLTKACSFVQTTSKSAILSVLQTRRGDKPATELVRRERRELRSCITIIT